MRSFVKCVALVCLVLTFWSALAVVTHHHSNATEEAKCAVCLAAHSASPKTTSTLSNTTFLTIFIFRAKPVSTKQHLIAFALLVRPPPSV
jgi:hypothetical protein